MDRLRTECPWDRKQTHASLVPYLIEEAYEVQHAVEQGTGLREELGDVLLQVAFHSRVADDFDIDDVADVIVGKLVRRHPHVFGDVSVESADEVNTNWEAIKATERAGKDLFDGVPMGQPALSLVAQLIRRAEAAGAPEGLAHAVGQGVARELFDLVRRGAGGGARPGGRAAGRRAGLQGARGGLGIALTAASPSSRPAHAGGASMAYRLVGLDRLVWQTALRL
ncbi:hypothetical protein GCM10020219_094180 [Nonomuraea dietziae]